jgi:hypothetical protein
MASASVGCQTEKLPLSLCLSLECVCSLARSLARSLESEIRTHPRRRPACLGNGASLKVWGRHGRRLVVAPTRPPKGPADGDTCERRLVDRWRGMDVVWGSGEGGGLVSGADGGWRSRGGERASSAGRGWGGLIGAGE